MADDYESFAIIVGEVMRAADERGRTVTVEAIKRELAELIRSGDAKAYELYARQENWKAEVDFDANRIWERWYYATPKGIAEVERRGENTGL